jgi:hypothetical protein
MAVQITRPCALCTVETSIDELVLAPRRNPEVPDRKWVCLHCVEALRDELLAQQTQREPGD